MGRLFRDADVLRFGEKPESFLTPKAFGADAALFHADASARISFLRDAFTVLEFGNAFATSGSKTTTFVPLGVTPRIFSALTSRKIILISHYVI